MDRKNLHDVEPREVTGRDTIARYKAQFRATGYACLSILDGKSIDRVYCDFQDDFVVREKSGSTICYHFHQVKTKRKRNDRWTLVELFGLHKKKNQDQDFTKISASHVGKLLIHTVKFKDACGSVVFLTNVHFHDDIEEIISDLDKQEFKNKNVENLIGSFNASFVTDGSLSEQEIKENVSKLILTPDVPYINLKNHNFEALARDAIYKYSEIDLEYIEAREIIGDLLSLVENKSFTELMCNVSEQELDEQAGIGIDDLLDILSISKGAYTLLLEGGDPKALKSASIIQRKLKEAGANEDILQYCSRWKIEWDVWFRDKRHVLAEFDLNFLLNELNEVLARWIRKEIAFRDLKSEIDTVWSKLEEDDNTSTLSRDLLFGGVLSALVRSESQ